MNLQQQLNKALASINLYRLTLKWVSEDLEAGIIQGTTLASAKSNLALHFGAIQQAEALSPEAMWQRFIDHLNTEEPLGRYGDDGHKSFIGSIEKYKRLFITANKDI